MKKIVLFLIILKPCINKGQTPNNDSHWQLVWEDNFNTLNTNIWKVKDNFDHYSGLADTYDEGEPQVYTNRTNNVFVSNGNLVLKIQDEDYSCPTSALFDWGCSRQAKYGTIYNYTSGWVESKEVNNTQYGYIESRIKLPYGYGFWPAFWTLAGSGVNNAANAAEIDIFEMIAWSNGFEGWPFTNSPSIFTTNVWKFYPSQDPVLYNQYPDLPSAGIMSDYRNWHIYAIEWSPSKIIWYIDNYPVRVQAHHGIIDPVRIILNLALGDLPNSSTPFPSEMLIDYVRVYDLKDDCSNAINSYNYDFTNHENKLNNFIYLQGQNSLSTDDSVILRASQYVHVEKDFSVPLGASLYIDVNDVCDSQVPLKCSERFNPCSFDFNNYDNSVKKTIELGSNSCNISIVTTNSNIILEATSVINLNPGVSITPTSGKSVDLKITTCE